MTFTITASVCLQVLKLQSSFDCTRQDPLGMFTYAGLKPVCLCLQMLKSNQVGFSKCIKIKTVNSHRYLIKFLAKLSEYQDANKMTPGNMAIVLGPNLLWTHTEPYVPYVVFCIVAQTDNPSYKDHTVVQLSLFLAGTSQRWWPPCPCRLLASLNPSSSMLIGSSQEVGITFCVCSTSVRWDGIVYLTISRSCNWIKGWFPWEN